MCQVYSCTGIIFCLFLVLPNCSASSQNTGLASCQQSQSRSASLSTSGAVRRFNSQRGSMCNTPPTEDLSRDTIGATNTRCSTLVATATSSATKWDEISTCRSPAAALEFTTRRGWGRSPPGRCFQMKLLTLIPAVSSPLDLLSTARQEWVFVIRWSVRLCVCVWGRGDGGAAAAAALSAACQCMSMWMG